MKDGKDGCLLPPTPSTVSTITPSMSASQSGPTRANSFGSASTTTSANDPVKSQLEKALQTLSMDDLWGERESVEDRFGDINGALRWRVVMGTHIVGQQVCETKLKLFSPLGKRLLHRHPSLNTRLQASAVLEYAGKFYLKGYMAAFCGPLIVVKVR